MGRQLKQGCREGRCPGRDKNSQVLRAPKNEAIFLQELLHADRKSRCSRFPWKFRISCRLPK